MKMNILKRACPVCDSFEGKKVFKRDFSGMSSIVPFLKYEIVQCEKCGMMYADNLIQSMPLAEYYNVLSKYETHDNLVSKELKEMYAHIVKFVSTCIEKNDDILDIGCGNGNLLHMLRESGYTRLTGVEPSETNIKNIKVRWGIEAYTGEIGDELPGIAGRKYKLIIMQGVLEHLLECKEKIRWILEYLDDDGYLYIGIPDVSDFIGISDLYQQFSTEHINYFSLMSLNNLMGIYGLSCIKYERNGKEMGISLWKNNSGKRNLVCADDGNVAMQKYLAQAEVLSVKIRSKLADYAGKSVYLWGSGTHTAMLYQLHLLDDINVEGIVDSNENYHGKIIFGHEIISPEKLKVIKKLPIVISSQLAQDSIERQILKTIDTQVVKLYSE